MDFKFSEWYVIDVYFEYKLSYLNAWSYEIGTPMTILLFICIYVNIYIYIYIH